MRRALHRLHANEIANAEANEVTADWWEEKGAKPTARAFARQAAEIYERIGWSMFCRHWRTTSTADTVEACEHGWLAYRRAAACWRRGMNYTNGNNAAGHATTLRERSAQALLEGRTFAPPSLEEVETSGPIEPIVSAVVGRVGPVVRRSPAE